MIQRLLNRDAVELRFWRVQEWTTRRGQPHGGDFLETSATHALMYGVMLAVDGKQRLALPASLAGNQLSSRHQTFFVSKPNRLPRPHSLVCSFQPSYANDRANHEVGIGMSCNFDRACRSREH